MRLTMRVLRAAALLAACIPGLAHGQNPAPTPTPAPAPVATTAEPATTLPETSVAPANAPAAAPTVLPTPATNPSVMRIVEPPSITAQKLPSENPYAAAADVPAALPTKLPLTDAKLSIGFFVSMRVDPTGKTVTARRDRDPIPSLAGETLKSLQRWSFNPARRAGLAVDTWGAYRLDLAVEMDAPRIVQQTLTPVTAATPLPKPFAWPSETDWLESRHPANPDDGTVSILEVDTAPLPQKTPWSAGSYKGAFSAKFWIKVNKAGRIEKMIPIEVTDPVLLPYFRQAMSAWTLRPAQAGGAPIDSWNELSLSGSVSFDNEIKQISALRRAIGP
jgi:hypothetical protein